MPILSDAELANLRQSLSDLLPDKCTITRNVTTDDAYGGQTTTPEVIATDVPIMLAALRLRHSAGVGFDLLGSPSSPSQVLESGKYNLTLPQATDIQLNDTVVITTLDNLTLRVITVITTESLEVVKQAAGLLKEEE